MTCDRAHQIHAYHDGELPAGEHDALIAHLGSCAQCRELLSDLRGLSRMIAATSLVEMPPDAMQRLQQAHFVLPDAGVLKIAGWLTAAAAAVLLSALLYFPKDTPEAFAGVPELLDTEAVAPPVESAEGSRADFVALAQWMADDLTAGETR